jgi:signal transduction histidine kinase
VSGRERLWTLAPGARRFQALDERLSRFAVLAEDRAGRLWVSDGLRGTRPLAERGLQPLAGQDLLPVARDSGAPAAPGSPVYARAKQLLFSQDGSLWLSEAGVGVHRLREAAAIPSGRSLVPADGLETFAQRDGLPSDIVVPLWQTDEGEVWVGTNQGLAGFRPKRVQTVTELTGAQRDGFVLAPHDSGVIAARQGLALALDPPRPAQVLERPPRQRVLLRAPDGALWSDDGQQVWREFRGQRQRMPIETLAPASGRLMVQALAPDHQGGAWLALSGLGVVHVRADAVRREPRAELNGRTPTAIACAADGSAWFGHDDELIRLGPDGRVQHYGSADGLMTGRSTALHAGRSGFYVAGESGLARFDGQRFVTLLAERDPAFAHVSGIAESEGGDLWLNGGQGLVQLLAADLPRVFAHPGAALDYRLLNWRDGLPGIALQASAGPTAMRDGRGRLWFSTNRGIAWLDPAQLARDSRPPAVAIQHLRVGDRLHRPEAGLALPAGTQTLALRYTALTLSAAERVRFRHRLDGVDSDWQDADSRREATYANLGPGDYRFRVIAANADGVWSRQPAELHFSVAPTLLQSRAFFVGCLLLLAALAWLGFRLRERNIAARVRAGLEARHGERERIARELHDTLLQSTQGLIIHVQGLASRLPAQEPVRQQIEAMLDRADGVVLEARERVLDLRATELASEHLAERLQQEGQQLAEGRGIVFRLVTEGPSRPLQRAAADELHCIGREALVNAFRHGRPRQVEVELASHPQALVLRVRDDGVGLSPGLAEGAAPSGHWGLAGMRERARQLGARLQISSRPQAGTEVECRVPAGFAYRDTDAAAGLRPAATLPGRWLVALRRWASG